MSEAQKDTKRALAACKEICDGRHPSEDGSAILVTLDHVISTILITAMNGDEKMAVKMLHEGVLPHVEERIALYASRMKG